MLGDQLGLEPLRPRGWDAKFRDERLAWREPHEQVSPQTIEPLVELAPDDARPDGIDGIADPKSVVAERLPPAQRLLGSAPRFLIAGDSCVGRIALGPVGADLRVAR
jgi:hypothetical protein